MCTSALFLACICDMLLPRALKSIGRMSVCMSSSVDFSRITGSFSSNVTEAWMLFGLLNTGLKQNNNNERRHQGHNELHNYAARHQE